MAIENIGLYPITIDVYKKHKETTVQANDNDSNGRGLLITLVKDGIPFNSTGISLKIGFRNAVGEERLYDCDIVDVLTGKYKVFYPTEMLQGNGGRVVKLEIKAFEATGALLNYSPVFVYVNPAEISNDAIGGTNEASTLVNALSQVQDIDNRFNAVNAQLAQNTELIGNANILGSSPQSLSTSLSQRGFNIKDFGVVGDNATDDTIAFQNAINTIPEGSVLIIPNGIYLLTGTITINKQIVIKGASAGENGRTVLKFIFPSGFTGDNAITLTNNAKSTKLIDLYVRDYSATLKKVIGISTLSNAGYTTHLAFENVWVSGFLIGIHLPMVYLSRLRDCYAVGNAQGFVLSGFSTSLILEGCYARANDVSGYSLSNITYSTLMSCASDDNAFGYYMKNCRGVKINACGVEGNSKTGFYLVGCKGISIDSCFGVLNGSDPTTNLYGTFGMVENDNVHISFNNIVEENIGEGGNRTISILIGANATGSLTNNTTVLKEVYGVNVIYNGQYLGSAVPTTGFHHAGKVVWNKNAFSGGLHGHAGWICVESGTPGVWKNLAPVTA